MTEFLHVNAVNCTLIWTPTILHNNMLKHNGLHWLNNNTVMHLNVRKSPKKLALLLLNFTACRPTKEPCSFLIALLILDNLLYNMYTMFIGSSWALCLLSYLKLVPPELYRALFNDLQDFWRGQVTSLAVLLNPGREERENLQTTRPNIVIPVHKVWCQYPLKKLLKILLH